MELLYIALSVGAFLYGRWHASQQPATPGVPAPAAGGIQPLLDLLAARDPRLAAAIKLTSGILEDADHDGVADILQGGLARRLGLPTAAPKPAQAAPTP